MERRAAVVKKSSFGSEAVDGFVGRSVGRSVARSAGHPSEWLTRRTAGHGGEGVYNGENGGSKIGLLLRGRSEQKDHPEIRGRSSNERGKEIERFFFLSHHT